MKLLALRNRVLEARHSILREFAHESITTFSETRT